MDSTTRTAHADQLACQVRDARDRDGHAPSCDALDPCDSCKANKREVHATRRAARVAAEAGTTPKIPAPRQPSMLRQRLARR